MDKKLEFNLEQESFRILNIIDYDYGKKKYAQSIINYLVI